MDTMNELDIKIKCEPYDSNERRDPTSFLPEEPMSYEIKVKKKKKKKKKKQEDDPFKDIQENVLITERVIAPDPDFDTLEPSLDPEVTIKAENIEVELDFNDFNGSDEPLAHQSDDSQEPVVKLETDNKDAVLLTIETIVNDKLLTKIAEQTDAKATVVPAGHMCKVCHLIFKNHKTLKMHQKRKHKAFRQYCKHVCDECGMAYDAKSSLVAHIKRRHGPDADNDNEERACEECSLVFKGMGRLRLHMQRKHGAFTSAFKHICEDCGIAYEKFRSLLVHRRRKHFGYKAEVLDQWINCPFCPKMFDKRETYARHMQRKHHSDNGEPKKVSQDSEELKNYKNEAGEIYCKQCPCVFSSLTYLKVHMRRKHNALQEDFRLKCRICNLSYNRSESLKRHILRKHDQGSYCNVCRKQFDTRELYLNHSHVKSVNECSICGLIFATLGGLGKHLRCIHKIETPKVVFCNICNEGFHDKRQLKPHLLRDHYRVSYTCKTCNKIFKTKESYHRHITVKHNETAIIKEPIHKCEECSESFLDELELCKHVNLVHSEPETKIEIKTEADDVGNPYRCTKCPETFPTWELLRCHYVKNHYVVRNCMCQKCGEEVKGEAELQKHIKQVHTEELECRFCDFKTKVKVTMTQHMLRHKNASTLHCDFLNCKYKTFYVTAMEKHKKRHQDLGVKFQCTQCSFQTMNKYVLRYHEENHETGKKRYNCDKCEYATNLPANLIQHKYKHSTEKRFKCDQCPFATKYNTSLRFHVKKKHCDLPMPS